MPVKKTLTKAQFLAWLTDRNACPDAREWARKQKTARAILEKCWRNDWLLWLIERVQGPALAEYERIQGTALAQYERVRDPALRRALIRRALTWERVVKAVKP